MKYRLVPTVIGGVALLGGLFGHSESIVAANLVGDGHDDLIVGAPGESPGASPRSGAAYLFGGTTYGVNPIDLIDQGGLDINEAGDLFGSSVAAGDFNGDGEDDVAIGAPGESPGMSQRSGAVYVYLGTAAGPRASAKLDQTGLGTNEYNDRFGETMIAADFNADGFDDLVVGAPGEELGSGPEAGAVFLFIGSPKGLLPAKAIDQSGLGINEQQDMFGAALGAGDFDGDGWVDLAVGAPGEAPGPDPQSGAVFLFRGHINGLSPDKVIDQTDLGANEQGDMFGHALTAGDFNGDGRDDLAVGAPGEAPGDDPESGAVFVFRGSAKGLQSRQVISQTGFGHNELGDEFGWALASGDYNGDGRDELAIGAPGKTVGGFPESGMVVVFRGDAANLVLLQTLTQTGMGANEAHDRLGETLASGNFTGDYRMDLAVGAPGEAAGNAEPSGGVYLFRGYSLALTSQRFIDQSGIGADEGGDMFGAALMSK